MVAAGLPVPPGYHITTEAYRRYVDENHLGDAALSLQFHGEYLPSKKLVSGRTDNVVIHSGDYVTFIFFVALIENHAR